MLAMLAVGAALWASAPAEADAPPTPTGVWAGTVSFFTVYLPGESYERARMTLTFKGRTAVLVASGKTGASHDPSSATATCTNTFRLVGSEGGWLVFRQSSPGSTKGEGGVLNGPCTGMSPTARGGLRVRPAGRRLKAEMGMQLRDDPPRWDYRSYLTRA